MNDIKKYTGSVNVNGDITPITRKKIERVEPNKWEHMDLNSLWNQRNILVNRQNAAFLSSNAGIALQLNSGILRLDQLISQKYNEVETEK